MLTDRQQKFYNRIGLLASSSGLTDMEKRSLDRAKKWLDRGDDFDIVINSLDLSFNSLESERLQGQLTPVVKRLFEDLKAAYGEPKESRTRIGGGGVPLVFLD